MKKMLFGFMVILFLGSTCTFAIHQAVIWGADVTYKSSTEVTITAGSGRCNSTEFEITSPIDLSLTSVLTSGEDYIYIYIDDDASSYPTPTIIAATTEPTWSDSKIGWYNGDDRCIGAVYSPSGSSTIWHFVNQGGIVVFCNLIQIASDMTPNSYWQTPDDAESSTKLPVNAVRVKMWLASDDTSAVARVAATSYEIAENDPGSMYYGAEVLACTWESVRTAGWVTLGASRNVRIAADSNDDASSLQAYIGGFYISR